MTVSAPTTPAHGDRSLNLQSESLAWLDKASLSSDTKENLLDVPSSNQYSDMEFNDSNTVYKVMDESTNASEDSNQLKNLNGKNHNFII